MILKDCYSFGTPRLGDGDFVSAFEEVSLKLLSLLLLEIFVKLIEMRIDCIVDRYSS